MASYRNVTFTMTIHAKTAKKAQSRAERIIKMSRVKKVHAYQIVRISAPVPTYLVDIILKESVTHRSNKKNESHASSVGQIVYSKLSPDC